MQVEASTVGQFESSGSAHAATAELLRSSADSRSAAARYSTDTTALGCFARDAARAVRLEAAGNRSCPPDGLRQLAAEGFARVHHKTTPKLMKRIVANPSCDPSLVARLAVHCPDLEIRALAHEHPNCPRSVLRAAPGKLDRRVREAAARNPNCPPDVLVRLAADPDSRIRRRVVAHPGFPKPLLTQLADDPDEWVIHSVVSRSDCPAEALAAAAAATDDRLATRHWRDLLRLIADHPNTPPQALAVLASSPIEMVRYEAVARSDMPVEAVVRLAADPDSWMVRCSAARNPNCPPDTAAAAARDPDWRVRESTAAAVNLPRSALNDLAEDPLEKVSRRARWLIRALDDPDGVLSDPDTTPRQVAARYARCPSGLLAGLAADPDMDVRLTAVSNPRCPPEGLRRAVEATLPERRHRGRAADADRIIKHVAEHPNCPPRLLTDLQRATATGRQPAAR